MQTFDILYYGLSLALLLVVIGVVIWAGWLRARLDDLGAKVLSNALLLAGTGSGVALICGVGLNALAPETGDLFYQRAHFGIFYVAFAAILYGVTRLLGLGSRSTGRLPNARLVLIAVIWVAYAIAVLIPAMALVSLAGPASEGGHVPQQPLYFVPVFVSLAITAAAAASQMLTVGSRWQRRSLAWLAMFAMFTLLGFLREANLIPSTGQPIADLLAAFGPFVLAGGSLALSLQAFGRPSGQAAAPRAA